MDLKIFTPAPDQPPPFESAGIIGWLKENLFSTKANGILTIIALIFLWKTLPPLISWAFIDATWSMSPSSIPGDKTGACWTFIFVKFRVLMLGLYPENLIWRPVLAFFIFTAACLATGFRILKPRMLALTWLLLPLPIFFLINGGLGLAKVEQSLWGGLMLSTGLAAVGIIWSIPIGILLALGRRSTLPVVKAMSVAAIECIRGVPLITILFMASVMLPIFLPRDMNINNLLRVQIGIILFSSAYIAEVVRGGLQAMDRGQYEAAESLGLNYFQMMRMIILPQALKIVIPPTVGILISAFKDTSLVVIIALYDILNTTKSVLSEPEWTGFSTEAYIFIAMIFYVCCFSMSQYSRRIEKQLEYKHTPNQES